MPDDVVLRFQQQGAEQAAKSIDVINSALGTLQQRAEQTDKAFQSWAKSGGTAFNEIKRQAQVQETLKGFQGIESPIERVQGMLGKMSEALKAGGASSGLLSVGLDTARQSLQVLQTPMGGMGLAVGAAVQAWRMFRNEMEQVAAEAQRTYQELRALQASMGGTAEEAEDIANAFTLAGAGGGAMQMAVFRLGFQLESGGKQLRELGIEVRDANGEFKDVGDVLLEARDRISQIGDAGARNAALMQLFGRAGRELAPAFNLPRGEFEKLIEVAQKYTAASPAFMDSSKSLARAQAELAQAQEQANARVATFLANPVVETLTRWRKAWVEFRSSAFEGVMGFLGVDIKGVRAAEEQAAALEKQAKEAQAKRSENKRLLDVEAQELIQRANSEFELQQKRMKMTSSLEAERLKVEKDAASEGLQIQIQTNAELVALENERYEKIQATRRRTLLPGGQLDPKETERLEREHQSRLLEIEGETSRLRLQQQQAFAQEYKRNEEMRVKAVQNLAQQQVEVWQNQGAAEKAVLTSFGQDRVQIARGTYAIDVRMAQDVARTKIDAIRQEEDSLRTYAAKFPQIAAVQQEVQQRLMELSARRMSTERETDKQIFESRKQLVDQLKQLAEAEAQIGASQEEKALARLERRGRKRVTAADIAEEQARMGREAHETYAGFATGGRVSIEALRESRAYGRDLAQMQELGTTAAGARGMFARQQAAAYAGQPFRAMPTAVTAAGQGPEIEAIVRTYVERLTKSETTFSEGLDKITEIVEGMFESFSQRFMRRLEFESARQ